MSLVSNLFLLFVAVSVLVYYIVRLNEFLNSTLQE